MFITVQQEEDSKLVLDLNLSTETVRVEMVNSEDLFAISRFLKDLLSKTMVTSNFFWTEEYYTKYSIEKSRKALI